MKQEIIQYFKTDRSHASGVSLIIRYSNHLALKKQVNIHPESEYMTGVIREELRELAGISREELRNMLKEKTLKPFSEILQNTQKSPTTPTTPTTNSDVPLSHPDEPQTEKKAGRKK